MEKFPLFTKVDFEGAVFIVKTTIKPSSKNEVILFSKTHSDWFNLFFYKKIYELHYSSPDIIFSSYGHVVRDFESEAKTR